MGEREKSVKIFSNMLMAKLNFPFLPVKTVHEILKVINEFGAPDHSRNREVYCLQPWAKLSNSSVAY